MCALPCLESNWRSAVTAYCSLASKLPDCHWSSYYLGEAFCCCFWVMKVVPFPLLYCFLWSHESCRLFPPCCHPCFEIYRGERGFSRRLRQMLSRQRKRAKRSNNWITWAPAGFLAREPHHLTWLTNWIIPAGKSLFLASWDCDFCKCAKSFVFCEFVRRGRRLLTALMSGHYRSAAGPLARIPGQACPARNHVSLCRAPPGIRLRPGILSSESFVISAIYRERGKLNSRVPLWSWRVVAGGADCPGSSYYLGEAYYCCF